MQYKSTKSNKAFAWLTNYGLKGFDNKWHKYEKYDKLVIQFERKLDYILPAAHHHSSHFITLIKKVMLPVLLSLVSYFLRIYLTLFDCSIYKSNINMNKSKFERINVIKYKLV